MLAAIPDIAPVDTSDAQVMWFKTDHIAVHRFARPPRADLKSAFVELLRYEGLTQPLAGRLADLSGAEIADGRHRLLAAQELNIPQVPVAIGDYDESAMFRIALYANVNVLQEELPPLAVAELVANAIDVGVTTSYLTRILPLSEADIRALGVLAGLQNDGYTVAYLRRVPQLWRQFSLLAAITDSNIRHVIADRVAQRNLSLESTGHLVAELVDLLQKADWASSEEAFLDAIPIWAHYQDSLRLTKAGRASNDLRELAVDTLFCRQLLTVGTIRDYGERRLSSLSPAQLIADIDEDLKVIDSLLGEESA